MLAMHRKHVQSHSWLAVQVGVFSATLPPEALEITRKFMNKPVRAVWTCFLPPVHMPLLPQLFLFNLVDIWDLPFSLLWLALDIFAEVGSNLVGLLEL
jgi:hypothetical protein